MTAAEIIAEIKKLPWEEQRKPAMLLDEVMGNVGDAEVDEEFKRVANRVFETHAELFSKLAQ